MSEDNKKPKYDFDFTEILASVEIAKKRKEEVARQLKEFRMKKKDLPMISDAKKRVNDEMGFITRKIVETMIDRNTSYLDFKMWCIDNMHWIKAYDYTDAKTGQVVHVTAINNRERQAYNIRSSINQREYISEDTLETLLDFLGIELRFVEIKE
jgi:DNA-directed RNA polymerase subunit H (RpoH/RPB5)